MNRHLRIPIAAFGAVFHVNFKWDGRKHRQPAAVFWRLGRRQDNPCAEFAPGMQKNLRCGLRELHRIGARQLS